MDQAIDFAEQAAAPPLTSMFEDVHAIREAEPEPLRTRLERILARTPA